MNPDIYSAEYQRMFGLQDKARKADADRRAELHRKAIERRRKAKRGGKR